MDHKLGILVFFFESFDIIKSFVQCQLKEQKEAEYNLKKENSHSGQLDEVILY